MTDSESTTGALDGPEPERDSIREDVANARKTHADREEMLALGSQATIDAHMTAHTIAVQFLVEQHQAIADETNLDLTSDTRPAAIWQMTGRILGVCRLTLDALNLGYTSEVVHLHRAIHEGNHLLTVFLEQNENGDLSRWLAADEQDTVMPERVRHANARAEAVLNSLLTDQGIRNVPTTDSRARDVYRELSLGAHHHRKWTQDAVDVARRTMVMGRDSPWPRKLQTIASTLLVIEESVMVTGDAIERFHGPGWYRIQVTPLLASFEAMRREKPFPA